MAQPIIIFDAVNAASDRNSIWIDLGEEASFSLGVAFTGTDVAGNLSLQACISSSDPNVVAPLVVATIEDSTVAVSNSDEVMYSNQQAGYRWVRVVWDYTSGTGNMTAMVQIKTPRRY